MLMPAFSEDLGDIAGLRVADLGCGDASIGIELLQRGCVSYVGIDSSERMVADAASRLAGTADTVVAREIEAFEMRPASFGLIVSVLALHYVDGIIASSRRAGGRSR